MSDMRSFAKYVFLDPHLHGSNGRTPHHAVLAVNVSHGLIDVDRSRR